MPTDIEIEIAGSVDGVYDWIDSQISQNPAQCDACGKCCDFENYDHRLFVTSCELIYFAAKLGSDKPLPLQKINLQILSFPQKRQSSLLDSGFRVKPGMTNTKSEIYYSETTPGSMPADRCPYNIDGKCGVYSFRFAGCRIFSCKGDKEIQNQLSEQAVVKFKAICEKFRLPYRYTDLPTALNNSAGT